VNPYLLRPAEHGFRTQGAMAAKAESRTNLHREHPPTDGSLRSCCGRQRRSRRYRGRGAPDQPT
jgi:hypothetical protein